MARDVLVEDGVRYEVVDEDEPDDLLKAKQVEISVVDPAEPKAAPAKAVESPKATAPRTAGPAAKVEVIQVEDESEETEDDEEDLTDEEAEKLEADLDEWIKELVEPKVKEGIAKVQSTADKQIARSAKQIETLQTQMARLREEANEAKLEGLTPEERESFLSKQKLDERAAELDEAQEILDGLYKTQLVSLFVQDYGEFGVTADDLEEIDDPEKMESFCEKKALAFYRNGGAVQKPAEAVPAAAIAAVKARRPVPAGASAPSDIGGESPALSPQQRDKPAEGTGAEAMAKTLGNLSWQSVRIG